jgi:tRNA pseudouridine32 synthase/23S rRNA pseudouridine746 synthase
MAALGAPIRNDSFYPRLQERSGEDFSRPLQLLARALAFVDPLSGHPRELSSGSSLDPVA